MLRVQLLGIELYKTGGVGFSCTMLTRFGVDVPHGHA